MSYVIPRDSRGLPRRVSIRRPSEKKSISRSATRALDVLELFGKMRRPLRACQIARALEMHPSTTNQLLKTMVDSAHLLFDARAMTYLPSPRLVGFSVWETAIYAGDEGLGGLVRGLNQQIDMVVTLSTANDLFMQILEFAGPSDVPLERGQRISLFGSAIGSAYLATLETAEVVRLAERACVPRGEFVTVHETLSAIRRDGFADGPTSADGHWSIAMTLPSRDLPVRLVLGVAGPGDTVRPRLDALRAAMKAAIDTWNRSRGPRAVPVEDGGSCQ